MHRNFKVCGWSQRLFASGDYKRYATQALICLGRQKQTSSSNIRLCKWQEQNAHNFIMNYRNYITIEPNKHGGKPCVRGLRITAYEVLEYLASEMTEAEILDDFPDLTREDLKACIAYAADRERRFMTTPLST